MHEKNEVQEKAKTLTRKQAADYLNVGLSTLDLNLKEIPRLKIGKSVRYLPSDLDAFINKKREEFEG